MSKPPPEKTSSLSYKVIFDNALKAYQKNTGKNLQSDPLLLRIGTFDSPDTLLNTLREHIPAFDRSAGSDARLTNWVNPIVNVLSTFSASIGAAVSLAYPPAGVIIAGIGSLLSAAQAVNASQGVLVDLFERIENFFKRLEAYIELPPTEGMTDIIVKVMAEVLLILALATREIKQRKTTKLLKKLVGRSDIEDALQRLDKLTQEESLMAAAQGLRATHGVAEVVNGVASDVHSVDDKVKSVHDKIDILINNGESLRENLQQLANNKGDYKRNQLRQALAKWLSPPDPSRNYNTASDARLKGTSVWFTESSAFNDWKNSEGLLWIHGKPGSGKSVLASAIIQDINVISNAGSGHVAFFFFDFKDAGKQDARALLSSLIVQLSDQSDSFYDILLGFYSIHHDGTQEPGVGALTQCLEDMLAVPGELPIYIIIDALDECPDTTGIPSSREQVLAVVKTLVELNAPRLHLCITSRPEVDIRISLELLTLTSNRISLQDETGQMNDIINFINVVVYSDKNMRRWRDEDKRLAVETLVNRADGMFRWVFCQLEVLRHCFPPSVRVILAELPETLDETYERILHQIPKSNRVYAHRMLQCLTVAIRPLRVSELAEVLAINFTDAEGVPTLNENLRWEDQEQAVLTACSSLITVVDHGGLRVVQFSHFSVKEFLTSNRLATSKADASRYHHISLDDAHTVIAQACLCVLLRLSPLVNKHTVKSYPLAEYAAAYFSDHAEFENVLSHMLDGVDSLLDADKSHFVAWLRARGTLHSSASPKVVPLYYMAQCGFRSLVRHLISTCPGQVTAVGGWSGTPLHVAVSRGHIEISRLLLAHCVDADIRGPSDLTPLHLAASNGFFEIILMLIRRNANLDARNSHGRTPLHLIADGLIDGADHKYFDVVRILLEHGADTDVQDNERLTALHLTTSTRCLKGVQLLLEHGANPNVRNKYGQTPLHLSLLKMSFFSVNIYLGIVQLLLDHGTDVNAQNNDHSTPLHLASYRGLRKVVHMLLERGANPNARNKNGQTPLHEALDGEMPNFARDEYHEVVWLLLEYGAEVNTQNNDRSTPLHLSSYREHSKVLLEHGADVHARDSSGQTPFQVALARGNKEIMQLLSETM